MMLTYANVDLRVLAAHEAGHAVMAERYGLRWSACAEFIFDSSDFRGAAVDFFPDDNYSRLTPVQCSRLGWAGVISEHLSGHILHPVPFRLTAASFELWYGAVQFSLLSQEDQSYIVKAKDIKVACREAFTFLSSPPALSRHYRIMRDLVKQFSGELALTSPNNL